MDHDDEPLRLPDRPVDPPRPTIPVLAAIVPVAGALVLWQLTGSVFALWFAALGPLSAIAGLCDGLRGRRRARRHDRAQQERALTAVQRETALRHERERSRRWARLPDLAGFVADPTQIWRPAPERGDVLVVGRGDGDSGVRIDGRPHTDRAREVQRRARTIGDVPVTVPVTAGVAVAGPAPLAAGVLRALVLQVSMAQPPGALRATGDLPPGLPHAEATRGLLLHAGAGGTPLPAGVDVPLVLLGPGAAPPPRCAAVLTVSAPGRARLEIAGRTHPIRVEAVSQAQAARLAGALAQRAQHSLGRGVDAEVAARDLWVEHRPASGLGAPIGTCGGEAMNLDLVADGPHAVVIGVTGSGKSELLLTWAAGMCRGRSVEEVALLLVDFKGGRTFDPLRALPHVTGVLTDLDEVEALRAVESLRAEIRHRERVLAEHDARDVADAAGALGRLVIIVDEYAALVGAHPALHDLFADIVARGRALGMHLILASQRAAGAFRDAVLANAPLRVALRVTDAADSRTVLGTDEAACLSGLPQARGIALVRRAGDAAALTVRVARCTPDDLTALAARAAPDRARAPWLAALPTRIPLSETDRSSMDIVLGRADDPSRQRQPLVHLEPRMPGFAVVGGSGSGKSTILNAVAVQSSAVIRVPAHPEAAWDQAARFDDAPGGSTILIDDADAIVARLPTDYAAAFVEALERTTREAHGRGLRVVFSCARLSGALARIADLLPQRALLALPNRMEHVAAGGDADGFTADLPPGRGRWRGMSVQFVDVPAPPPAPSPEPARWLPGRRPAGYVAAGGAAARAFVQRCAQAGIRIASVDDAGAAAAPGTLLCGAPEAWLSRWQLLSTLRSEGQLVVDAGCAAEYRALTGRRDLPPYALPGRAWLHADGRVERIA